MSQNNVKTTDVEVKIKDESKSEIWLKKCYRPIILLALLILIVVLFIIVIALSAVIGGSDDTKMEEQEVCTSDHCVSTASRLLSAMNTEADPCENFYEFACGKWVESHRIPEDKGSIDTMEQVSDRLEIEIQDLLETRKEDEIEPIAKAKSFYRSCMRGDTSQRANRDRFRLFLKELGGWPVLYDEWDDESFDLEESIARARHYTTNYVWPIPHGILMGLNVLNDFKVYGKHVIYFDQPSLLMEGRDMYLGDRSSVSDAYTTYATSVAEYFGANAEEARRQMEEMVEFETDLAKISVAVSDRWNMEENYQKMTVYELEEKYPSFDWIKYLKETFSAAGVTIKKTEPVVMWMTSYYDKLFPLLERTDKKVIANYIVWRLITTQFVAIDELNLMRLEFRKVTEGVKQLKPKGQRCVETTNKYLDQATGRIYAEKNFGPTEREHMLELISYLRRVFRQIVTTAEWMDQDTKDMALRKLEKMKSLIGFPSFIFNNTLLTEYYQTITFRETNFFDNLKKIRKYVGLKQLAELRQPSYEKWPERPAICNAFYHSGLNAIVFPAGILNSPYYDINHPASINFGGIGLVIGHEITHGYDASGRSFDEDGLLHNWWTEESLKNFNTRAECVISHYSNFTVPNVNMNINGKMTLSENIADIGGVKQSHMAYKLWLQENNNKDDILPGLNQYSHEQLFFINTAQLWCSRFTDAAAEKSVLTGTHSLPMFRVLGELRNSHGFSEVFKCPKGTYMNPNQEKCSLW